MTGEPTAMATDAGARDLAALRHQIARIEGRLAERLEEPSSETGLVTRYAGLVASPAPVLSTGVAGFDAALGGGLPLAALTEIHAAETRDAGAAAGLALALVSLLGTADTATPILWVGTSEVFREGGFPYALGLRERFGIDPSAFLVSETPRLTDALWVAEEAARAKAFAAVFLEVRGNAQALDLTATRRLHRRAQEAARPLFLLRQAAVPEPTAAPVRLLVEPSKAGLRQTVAGPLPRSIGPPGLVVAIDKSRLALPDAFELEWNPHERSFQERRSGQAAAQDPVAVVSLSQHRADRPPAPRAVVAFRTANGPARHQPEAEQHPAHSRPRRTG